jgi:hypothetical protein
VRPPVASAAFAANVGAANPKEFSEVTSTTAWMAPLTAATGGDSRRLADGSGMLVPRIVGVRSSCTFKGDDWIGLKIREASVVRGIGVLPMCPFVTGAKVQTLRQLSGRCGA